MITTISRLFSSERAGKGLGQLEAYTNVEEGVTFQMDDELVWDSSGRFTHWAIQGVSEKRKTSKFSICHLSSGKVTMIDWNRRHLAPILLEGYPNTYPLRLVPNESPENKLLQFDVFYIGNKVAFQAHNGLFLTRVYRDFHTIEANNVVDDDSCYFRPIIGDLQSPTFRILGVFPLDLPEIDYRYTVLQTARFENRSNIIISHTFTMVWETTVTDRIFWRKLWGCGVASTHEIEIDGMTIPIKYTEDNERIVHVKRNIHEEHRRRVLVPPRSTCTACLSVYKSDTAFSFLAFVHKVKPNGVGSNMNQTGAWTGLLYKDMDVGVEIEKNYYSCTIQ